MPGVGELQVSSNVSLEADGRKAQRDSLRCLLAAKLSCVASVCSCFAWRRCVLRSQVVVGGGGRKGKSNKEAW